LYDDSAIARDHAFERRHGAKYKAEIGDFRRSPVLLRGDFEERRGYRLLGVADPDVNRPERHFDFPGGGFELRGVRDIRGNDQGCSAKFFDFIAGGFETRRGLARANRFWLSSARISARRRVGRRPRPRR
jgi:hypothetical protein